MNENERPSRPVAVTIIALVVLYVSATGLLRLFQSIINWNYLAGVIQVSPAYLASSGLIWGLLGLCLVWGLWRGKAWSRRFSMVFFLSYFLYFWIDRFSIPGSEVRNINWMFNLGVQIFFMVFFFWTMSRKNSRAYLGVANE